MQWYQICFGFLFSCMVIFISNLVFTLFRPWKMLNISDFDLSVYAANMPHKEKLNYCGKLSSVNSFQCFYKIHQQYWTDTEQKLKSLVKMTDRNDLFFYFIYKDCNLDGKQQKSVKSIQSFHRFLSGHLRAYWAMKLPGGYVVVKGLVSYQ